MFFNHRRDLSVAATDPSSQVPEIRGPKATISGDLPERYFLESLGINPNCEVGFPFLEQNYALKVVGPLARRFATAAKYVPPLEKTEAIIAKVMTRANRAEQVILSTLRQFLRDYLNQAAALGETGDEIQASIEIVPGLARVFKLEKELGKALIADDAGAFLNEIAEEAQGAQKLFKSRQNGLVSAARICSNLADSMEHSGRRMSERIERLRDTKLEQPWELMRLFKTEFTLEHLDLDTAMGVSVPGCRVLGKVFQLQLASVDEIEKRLEALAERIAKLRLQQSV